MNSKKANRLFLGITIFHFAMVYGLMLLPGISLTIASNLFFSELILLLPSIVYLGTVGGNSKDKLRFRKMKPGTCGMVILFTFLTMPLTTLVNAISMLFVDNVVVQMSGDVVSMPFFLMLFFMAVYGPVCEEITFRGIMFQSYRNRGSLLGAILLSALTFGLIHMNFNQMPYAMVIGVLLALLVEATGSIWSSILYHFIFNAQSVCLLYASSSILSDMEHLEAGMTQSKDTLLYMIGAYAVLALIATSAAIAVLVWIARHEGREEHLKGIWQRRHQKQERMVTLPLILAVVLCLGYSLFVTILPYLISSGIIG